MDKKYILKNKFTGRYLVYDLNMRNNALKFAGFDINAFKVTKALQGQTIITK